MGQITTVPGGGESARERVLGAAYELFSTRGIQAVGVDAIIQRSGVARQTLYRQFGSKQELVLACLALREQLWTRDWLEAQIAERSDDPSQQLLAIFDVFDEWFRKPGFEGCTFINVMLEHAAEDDPIRVASTSYLSAIRGMIERLAREAGLPDPDDFARKWHILMKGSIVAAGEGDADAARRAQEMGQLLLAAAS
jgi:AcrR family transcriptional regulator